MHGTAQTQSIAELVGLLSSPDPKVRDDLAYAQLAERISSGGADGALGALGADAVGLFEAREIHARSFGALLLAEVVARDGDVGTVEAATLGDWLVAFARWYLAEEDLRGWDDQLGWLHAVAHGADVIAAFARSPRTHAAALPVLLAVGRDRLLGSDSALFANQEDDRLAYAIALVLARTDLSTAERVEWLRPLRLAFEEGEPGPVPLWVTNTLHTLRALYVLVARGVLTPPDGKERLSVPRADEVAEEIAGLLRIAFPFVG